VEVAVRKIRNGFLVTSKAENASTTDSWTFKHIQEVLEFILNHFEGELGWSLTVHTPLGEE